jgi:hypothetical protein
MKKCTCCGGENADDALNCRECGTGFEHTSKASPATRSFTGTEWGILALAVLFIVFGGVAILYPTEMNVFHQSYRGVRSSFEHVSKDGSRIYGGFAMLVGAGLTWLVFYGRKK